MDDRRGGKGWAFRLLNLHLSRVALAPKQCLGRFELLGLVERLGLLAFLRLT